MPIRIVLADDHPIVLAALDDLFSSEPDFTVVARCYTGAEALDALRRQPVDVLVLDFRMPGLDGLGVLRAMAQEKLTTAVALYTVGLDGAQMQEAIRLGARGLVLKEMPPRLLVDCVRAVHAGQNCLETTPAVASALRERSATHS